MTSDGLDSELVEIGVKMAQTIQEFIDDIEQAGNKKPFDLISLIEEWETVYKKTGDSWQSQLASKEVSIKGIL